MEVVLSSPPPLRAELVGGTGSSAELVPPPPEVEVVRPGAGTVRLSVPLWVGPPYKGTDIRIFPCLNLYPRLFLH